MTPPKLHPTQRVYCQLCLRGKGRSVKKLPVHTGPTRTGGRDLCTYLCQRCDAPDRAIRW